MDATSRMQSAPIKNLIAQPELFNFFQAINLLERYTQNERNNANNSIGLKFKALPNFSFPTSSIHKITYEHNSTASQFSHFIVQTGFMGLTGANGVLPKHYTELLLARIHAHDHVLSDFLDIFNDHLISLFYHAWKKTRITIDYQPIKQRPEKLTLVTRTLLSLIGNGLPSLTNRLAIADETLCYYAGHFAHQVRSTASLENMLNDFFSVPVKLLAYQKERLKLADKDRSRLGNPGINSALYNCLGVDIVIGQHSTIAQGKFRLCIGPLTYAQFQQFLPSGSALQALLAFVRYYINFDLVFDIQLILQAQEVPRCQLCTQNPFRLGWNTWLYQHPLQHHADQLIIQQSFLQNE